MKNNEMPIGVFDSGVGGLSVLKELYALMPNENYIYYGDSLHAPYGVKSDEEIESLTKNAIEKLTGMGAKAVVIACNTATSVAATMLRSVLSVPVIGIEPAIKPASLEHKGQRIVVMATPVTLKRQKFLDLMCNYENDAEIIPLPCPGLAELIEEYSDDADKIEKYIKELFAPFEKEKPEAIVLGCTHYPHITDIIKSTVGYDVSIYDGGKGTAKETKRRLEEIGALSKSQSNGTIQFVSSSPDKEKVELMKKIFERII